MDAEKLKRKKQMRKLERPKKCEQLGKRIAMLRIGAEFKTQVELAKRLPGITSGEVSNWEIGFSAPDIFLVPDICRALNCTYAQFFGQSIFYAEKDISKFSAITKLNEENLQKCLAFADFLESQQQSDLTDKK